MIKSYKLRRTLSNTAIYILLAVLGIIWIFPLVWLVLHSFRINPNGGAPAAEYNHLFPSLDVMGFDNYIGLFTDVSTMNFPRMFMNTFIIAIFTCLISTFFVLSVSYCLSRVKWSMRKPYMNMAMVINLFPGFMSMVAIYFLLKSMGLTEGNRIPIALIICFTAGAGTGFTVMKGYMDTIPKALDEAAMIDGCTRWQTFYKVTLPLCKPMVVYQVITAFMGPWVDFIFAKIIVRAETQYATVSIGMWKMLEMEFINGWFTRFCAAAVLVSIPIAILFMITQKFYQEAMGGAVKG